MAHFLVRISLWSPLGPTVILVYKGPTSLPKETNTPIPIHQYQYTVLLPDVLGNCYVPLTFIIQKKTFVLYFDTVQLF